MAAGMALRSNLRIIATVPTGFEVAAVDECQEKVASLPVSSRGRIAFTIDGKERLKAVSSSCTLMIRWANVCPRYNIRSMLTLLR